MSNCIVSTLIIKNRHIKRNLKLSVLVTARALSCQATLYTVMGCTVSFFGRGRCFCHGDVDTVSSTAFYWIWKVVLFFLFSVRRMRCRALRDGCGASALGDAVCLITVLWRHSFGVKGASRRCRVSRNMLSTYRAGNYLSIDWNITFDSRKFVI